MSENINIYDELERLNRKIAQMDAEHEQIMAWVKKYEPLIINETLKAELDTDDDLEGFYTINEILRKYSISRQCLRNYRKLVPLKKSTRIGRFDRFKKKQVCEFMIKIVALKKSNPKLFTVEIRKAS